MPDSYHVWLSGSSSVKVRMDALMKWCPVLLTYYTGPMGIDATGLVDNIDAELSICVSKPFSQEWTRKILKELFNYWNPNPAKRRGLRTRDALRVIFTEQMMDDIEDGAPSGLVHSRHHFIVYCLLAKETRSKPLAEIIAEFFELQAPEILVNEKHNFHREWYYGIQKLQGLIPDSTLMDILHNAPRQSGGTWSGQQGVYKPDPHVAWMLYQALKAQQNALPWPPQRGRSHGRDDRRDSPRASSLPPLPPPNNSSLSQRNIPTGISNRVWPNFVDHVNQLHWNQEEMNLKLDRIDRKLDCLMEN